MVNACVSIEEDLWFWGVESIEDVSTPSEVLFQAMIPIIHLFSINYLSLQKKGTPHPLVYIVLTATLSSQILH